MLKRSIFGIAAVALLSVVAGMSAAYAQSNNQDQEKTRKTPAIREVVYQPLAKAQACSQKKDFSCAAKYLSDIRDMKNKNSYETALMWQMYAYVYFAQDKTKEAMTAYENLLKQPNLPLGLEQTTSFTLAQLYVQAANYTAALKELDHWFSLSPMPGPRPYVLKAQIYYEMKQYKNGLPPILTALKLAQEQHIAPQEQWYQLLYVFYYELQDYKNVIKTLNVLANRWPKKSWIVQLAGMYGQQGNEEYQLALYQAADAMGWLTSGTEKVQLAQMLLSANVPYKAALILQKGLKDGSIKSSENNWRTLAQAWQLADDDEKAIPALKQAADLSKDGDMYYRLANSYTNLAQWNECVDASHKALDRGMKHADDANMLLGNCLVQLKKYDQAKAAFKKAETSSRARVSAQQWLKYIQSEEDREAQLKRAAKRAAG